MTSSNATLILAIISAYQDGNHSRVADPLDAAETSDRTLFLALVGGLAALLNSAGRDASEAPELLSAIAEEEADQ